MSSKVFKTLAAGAKDRMKSGFWQENYTERDMAMKNAAEVGTNIDLINVVYRNKIKRELLARKLPFMNEKELYDKVAKILESSELITNPIGQLIDREYFDTLNSYNKQKYVFNLSEAYVAIKNQIQEEKSYFQIKIL